jgi:hypothetical protein
MHFAGVRGSDSMPGKSGRSKCSRASPHPLRGDWHDRVVAVDILHRFTELDKQATPVIIELDRQESLLLSSARIYL